MEKPSYVLTILAVFKYANFGIETLNAMLARAELAPIPWAEVILPASHVHSKAPVLSRVRGLTAYGGTEMYPGSFTVDRVSRDDGNKPTKKLYDGISPGQFLFAKAQVVEDVNDPDRTVFYWQLLEK